ncbi:hypothetical protein [Pseudomonas sp. B707]|uniref:hypothetical protein n=1 Tax=Pseudomonas sp. B707 TaxID=2689570 RepID=UPI001F0E01B5|nr:hypothetical protein [Pseudomonas sp. B707]MCH4900581.1 hypothetical protein [Pseudomonas sp. B707]
MADLSWSQTLSVSLLTAAITLAGTSCQQAHQDERADKVRFLDGAQATAQETSGLVDNGYNALAKLVKGMDQKGWEEFSKGPLDEYVEFRRGWRQQLIAEHFKLSRYFGKNTANDLIHIDEIDIRPTDNLASTNPCSPPGELDDFDIEKLASEIECYASFVTKRQDAINERTKENNTDDFFEALRLKLSLQNQTKDLLQHYDKSSVTYLRGLDSKLTELGVSQVTILN